MVKKDISNRNGRALEYIIVQKLIEQKNCTLVNNSEPAQIRDGLHFDKLNQGLKNKFHDASQSIVEWLNYNFKIQNGEIDRLDDSKAVKGDVTDIRINGDINLSIKHNHSAVKHQRPGSLAQHCNFAKGSSVDKQYRVTHKRITENFLNLVKSINVEFSLFNEVKGHDNDFINKNLYKPVCDNVARFINENCVGSPENSEYLFRFIVGNTDFTKIIVYDGSIEIHEYSEIESPTDLTVSVQNDSYVKLHFNNGWIISMRLHTASSRLKGVSLKFDSQPEVVSVTKHTITY